MAKIKLAGVTLALLFFAGPAASDSGIPWYRHYDIGTLDATGFFNQVAEADNILNHTYTFDLLSASNISVRLVNMLPETGNVFEPWSVPTTIYTMRIKDSNGNELYKETVTDKWVWGSTMAARIDGELAAGNDYSLLVVAGAIGYPTTPQLAYAVHLAATPVPEPQAWGMLVAGLGVMGFVTLRRKHRVFPGCQTAI